MPNASRLTPITSIGIPRLCRKPIATSKAFTTSRNHVAAFPGLCPCHLDTRSPLAENHVSARAAHAPIQGLLLDRGRVQGLWGLPNISAFLRATCATLPPISAAGICRGRFYMLHVVRVKGFSHLFAVGVLPVACRDPNVTRVASKT